MCTPILHLISSHWKEIRVKGEPSYIAPLYEYAWYKWVKFHGTSFNFPYSNIQLGRDMGAVIYIGTVIARKAMVILCTTHP
jgi:hypothetical protein